MCGKLCRPRFPLPTCFTHHASRKTHHAPRFRLFATLRSYVLRFTFYVLEIQALADRLGQHRRSIRLLKELELAAQGGFSAHDVGAVAGCEHNFERGLAAT